MNPGDIKSLVRKNSIEIKLIGIGQTAKCISIAVEKIFQANTNLLKISGPIINIRSTYHLCLFRMRDFHYNMNRRYCDVQKFNQD